MEEPMDPRNEPSYDTYDYGTEPIPGDTTWAKQKEEQWHESKVSILLLPETMKKRG
jgi:hypothetical protein